MKAEHLEFLVEEPSMEAFLLQLLPKIIGNQATYSVHVHQRKSDLLSKLGGRLRAYSKWIPQIWRIFVIVDRDDDDCRLLKRRLEHEANTAGFLTRTMSDRQHWQIVNRIAVEEMEAWFFAEWSGVRKAYPRVSAAVPSKAAFRASDAISGGTWEALERIFKAAGYFSSGLRKMECARAIGIHFDPTVSASPSFVMLREAVLEAVTTVVPEGAAAP